MPPEAASFRVCPRCNCRTPSADSACSRCGQAMDGEMSVVATRGGAPAPPRVEKTHAERDAAIAKRRAEILIADLLIGALLLGAFAGFMTPSGVPGIAASAGIGAAAGFGMNRTGGSIHCGVYFGVAALLMLGVTGGFSVPAAAIAAPLMCACVGLALGRQRTDARFEGLA